MPSTPLLTTKLYVPPPREEAVARPRLEVLLERGKTRPLTLVSAPAGFGKTTLVSSWVRGGVRAAWVSLDEGDNDPARFWLYTLAALQTHHPTLGQEVFALLQTAQPPAADLILSLLINELAALPEPLVLILDDYHVIENQEIHKGLMFLLDHLPAQLRLLLATRGDPPFALARLRARGQLAEIRIADLAFTPAETTALFNEIMGLEVCEEDIAALETRTEGWVAGLQLAALSLQGKQDVRRFIQAFTGSHAYIVEYLVEDVLLGQPDEMQSFLLQTSILSQLSGPLCEAVTGRPDSGAMLERLRQANLFVVALDDERSWYRYHHLFAEVLRHRLRNLFADTERDLHARASAWFERANLPEDAIHHAFAAGDVERAAILVEQSAETWKKRGELVTALKWLERVPVEIRRKRWRLNVFFADMLARTHQLDEAERWLDEAEKSAMDPDATANATHYGEFFAARAFIFMRQSQFEGATFFAQKALSLLPADQVALRAQARLVLGVAQYWQDRHTEAREAFAETAELALQVEDWHLALNALSNHALMFSLHGKLREGEEAYRRALQLASAHHMEHIPITHMLYGNLADLACEWLDWPAYEAYQAETVRRAEIGVNPLKQIVNYGREIKRRIVAGEYDVAEQALVTAQSWAETHKIYRLDWLDLEHYWVRLWLVRGQLSEARQWVETQGLGADDPLKSVDEPLYIALARVYLASGQAERAIYVLRRLIAAAQAVGREWILVELNGLLVLALHADGQEEEAFTLLRNMLATAEPQGYLFSFLVVGRALVPLLQKLHEERQGLVAENPRLQAYIGKVLEAFGESVERQSSSRVALSEPLSDREQEILRYIDAGLSNREIADKLYISVSTVKTHINNLYAKLDANSRTRALAIARKLGLFSD